MKDDDDDIQYSYADLRAAVLAVAAGVKKFMEKNNV